MLRGRGKSLLRYLIPAVALRDLPVMLCVALVGALLAGCYGILHDQITYSISPEYYTNLKFHQFSYADFGWPRRVFVAEIGFLASFWVGLICAWFLTRLHLPADDVGQAFKLIGIGFGIVFACVAISFVVGVGYGFWRGPNDPYESWNEIVATLEITDRWAFVRVAYIHNASYLGGLIGLVVAGGATRLLKSRFQHALKATG